MNVGAASQITRARRRRRGRRGAHRSDLERVPRQIRGAIFVWSVRRGRRHVCAVIWRFHTYAVEVGAAARDYMRAVMDLPAWAEWRDAARRETWVLPHDEVDWPEVPRE